jgi:hypothetical protein
MAEDRANDPTRRFDPRPTTPSGTFHKGRSGYYEDHHSSTRYVGGCKSCMKEEKSGKHPLA